jgi:succinyl-diaminopimelate desuccinylase
MQEQWQRVAERIEQYRPWAIEVQERLTACPAMAPESDGQGELKKAELLQDIMKEIGLDHVERIDAPDDRADGGIRPNLVARIPGGSGNRLWIMSHLDVVSEGDRSKWTSDPWQVRVDGDRLYGRGVEDNQQGIVASLLLGRALVEEQIAPQREVCLLMVADEEYGSQFGIRYLLKKNPPNFFGPDDLIVVPDGGRSDGTQIEIAEKSILWLKFTIKGRATHASTPERGINAHRAAAHLVVDLDKLHQRFSHRDPLFDPPISTFEPTKREANVASVNILPGEDVFFLDCRVLPCYDLEEIEREVTRHCQTIEEKFGVTVEWAAVQREVAAPPTSANAPVVLALRQAVRQVYRVEAKAEGIGGGTVAAYIRHAGYPAAVWARMDETMHTANEYVLLSNLVGDAQVFAYLALNN